MLNRVNFVSLIVNPTPATCDGSLLVVHFCLVGLKLCHLIVNPSTATLDDGHLAAHSLKNLLPGVSSLLTLPAVDLFLLTLL